ncbi:sedoheptulose 7-phosphate cyclase [Kitasatospora viridis]|uniref:2-epi-5-epi-valiolone synthase n=1 Tax=Kitasatospora viridis TaxID=281105 RepID=A0A561UMX6_9ACTN|nr:sedoheptulose 7-phosphate cyclase [Kitasatospora viridis]TWG00726.1 3-dehydroquinate synthase [Kitasatospora viridis]
MSWDVRYRHVFEYSIRTTQGIFDPENRTLAELAGMSADANQLLVVDEGMHAHWGDRIRAYARAHAPRARIVTIDAVEEHKSVEAVLRIAAEADAAKIVRRSAPIVAIGGGVLTDIVGLAASVYRRGTPYVRVPSTLIGMVDAAVGAKTAVNAHGHKNRLGTYYPASWTVIDTGLLSTVPMRHLANGVAEIIKMALVGDPELFELLAADPGQLLRERLLTAPGREIIVKSVEGMLRELEPNLLEKDLRRLVDFGHTFSPALELAADSELLHGEAVAVDMALCTVLAAGRGLVPAALRDRILWLLQAYGLPVTVPWATADLLWAGFEDSVRHRDGAQNFVVPVGFGRADFLQDVTRDEVVAAWQELQELTAVESAHAYV